MLSKKMIVVMFFFAVKANFNPNLLRIIFNEGVGAEVVSQGELALCLRLKLPAEKIVFSGPGKTNEELRFASTVGIHAIQVESLDEWDTLNKMGFTHVRVSLRVNFNMDVETHPYLRTFGGISKFGLSVEDAKKIAVQSKRDSKYARLVGVHAHLGSQILSTTPYRRLATALVKIASDFKRLGHDIEFVSVGGGFGLSYDSHTQVPDFRDYAKAIWEIVGPSDFRLHVEPGRSLIAESGVLVARVIRTKTYGKQHFAIIDAGMNDLIRPALYQAVHPIKVVPRRKTKRYISIVGPLCESSDVFCNHQRLSEVQSGDIVIIGHVGAYGMSMASNYNLRPRLKEVLFNKHTDVVIRDIEQPLELVGFLPEC